MLISRKDGCWKYELRGTLPAGEVSRSSGLVVLPYFDIVITKRPRTILWTMGQIGIKSFLFFRRLTWMRRMRPVHDSYIVVLAITSLENTSATNCLPPWFVLLFTFSLHFVLSSNSQTETLLRCRKAKEQRGTQQGAVWKKLSFNSCSCPLPLYGRQTDLDFVSSTCKSYDPDRLLNLRFCILMGKQD